MSLLSDIVSCYRSDVMPLFYTDHESQNHQKSINVWIRLDSWRIVNFPTHSLMFYDSSTKKGKKQLRIFAGFGWIRSESPHYCAKFTAVYNNIIIPPANFVCRGYTVFTLSVRASVRASVRVSVRPSVRPSVTLCFLNNSKSHCWIFIKPCKHVHICKTNT